MAQIAETSGGGRHAQDVGRWLAGLIVTGLDFVLGLRVPARDEEVGLDLAVYREAAYQS